MKNIEWLKDEILTDMRYLEGNREIRQLDIKYQTLREVVQKINSLDEPEVLSKEWIDEHEKRERLTGPFGNVYLQHVVPSRYLQNLLVPKQEVTFEQAYDKLREESILSEKSFDYYWNCINDNVEIDEPGNLLVPKQEEVDQAFKNGYEKGKQHTFYKGYLEGLADKENEPETVADVISDFWKSFERLKEVLGTKVEEMEE